MLLQAGRLVSLYAMRKNPLPSIACFLLLGGLGFAAIGTVACIRELSTEWINTPGVVTHHSASKRSDRGARFKPCIHYSFMVDGQEVEGRDCAYRNRAFESRALAIEIAKADYDGEITIWYNKKNPGDSRVLASRIRSWLPAMLGGATALGLGMAILSRIKKQRSLSGAKDSLGYK